jgi:hypothetical protein
MSARAAAKAKTHLNVALVRLDEAARLAHEAGLHRPAGTLERLAREAAEVLGKLHPPHATDQPTLPVDQPSGSLDQAVAS